jgi:hypothetical protein
MCLCVCVFVCSFTSVFFSENLAGESLLALWAVCRQGSRAETEM